MSPVYAECKEKNSIVLLSSDGEMFVVEEVVALQSEAIKRMMEEGGASSHISLPNVTSKSLEKVIEYCKRLAATAETSDSGTSSDEVLKESVKDLDLEMLFEIILAASCLSMKKLLVLMCETVGNKIKDFSPQQCQQLFNTKNDSTAHYLP